MTQNGNDLDHLLKLNVDGPKVEGVLRVEANPANGSITRDSLCAFLYGRNVFPNCILQDQLDALVAKVNQSPTQSHELLVVQGTLPVPGVDESFTLDSTIQKQFDQIHHRQAAYLKAKEDNSLASASPENLTLDFYNESPFLIVSKDQIIGQIHSPTDGEDGMNIFGSIIATKSGKSLKDITDSYCSVDKEGRVYSTIDGHLVYEHDQVKISSTLNIDDMVDFSTGNIDFPGDVVVSKGVRDRFHIKSQGDIEIHKLVEAAHLQSESDIRLLQGMAGRETGTIRVKGNLHAGYLEAVDASIFGDCQIKSELTYCSIQLSGKIDSPNAAIRGGELNLAQGGTVGTLGSVQGVHTEVIIAHIPDLEDKLRRANDFIPLIEKAIAKQQQDVTTLKKSIGKPNPEQATEIWFMESEVGTLNEQRDKVLAAIDALKALIRTYTLPSLTVNSMIFAKTVIYLPGYRATFENDAKGPLSVALNAAGKPVVIRNGESKPLNTIAKIIADDRVLSQIPGTDQNAQDSLSQAA